MVSFNFHVIFYKKNQAAPDFNETLYIYYKYFREHRINMIAYPLDECKQAQYVHALIETKPKVVLLPVEIPITNLYL